VATDVSGNSASCSFTVTVTMADLALTMSAKPSQARPNSNLTYTLTVKSSGKQAAQNVVLTDPLPAGVTFVSASGSPTTGTLTTPLAGSGGAVSWSIGTLGSGQSATLTLVVKTGSTTGTLTNTASVSSSVESNLGNNSATVTTTVR